MGWKSRLTSGSGFGGSAFGDTLNKLTMSQLTATAIGRARDGKTPATSQELADTGIVAVGGGAGLTYNYSRQKGMNEQEAAGNAITGGLQYNKYRGEQVNREDQVTAQAHLDALARSANDQQTLDANAAAFRVARRRQLAASASGYASTLLTGPQGLGDSSGGTAKTLLGA